jgi:filamentous hemagglutinin
VGGKNAAGQTPGEANPNASTNPMPPEVPNAGTPDSAGDGSDPSSDSGEQPDGAGAAKGAAADEQYVNLASGERTGHILYGDRPGSGGHMWPGMDGKTPFPESWSAPKIMHEVSDIVTDPSVKWQNLTGSQGSLFTKAGNPARWGATAVRDGVKVFVVYEPAGEGIITAYPVK